MKLSQLLFSQGFGTRRMCAQLIANGAIEIDGHVCDDPDAVISHLTDDFQFCVDGIAWRYREKAYLMLHKPAGYECSQKAKSYPSVYRLLPDPLRTRSGGGVQAVGRLDQDTTGLLLFSDDGQFIHRMASPKHHVPKIYDVTASQAISDAEIARLLAGVVLDDDPAPVRALQCTRMENDRRIQMTLAQGKYHQVKRMLAAVENHVAALHRSQVGGLILPADLPVGQWRWLSHDDLVRASCASQTLLEK